MGCTFIRYWVDSPCVAMGIEEEYKCIIMLTNKNYEMYMYGVGNVIHVTG